MLPLQVNHWLRALAPVKSLFENEGYLTTYLNEIEHFIKENNPLLRYGEIILSQYRNLSTVSFRPSAKIYVEL